MEYVTVVPAYGRDYKTRAEVIGDWHGGKDFALVSQFDVREFGGRYVNQVDLAKWNSEHDVKVVLHIRYRKLERIVEVLR